ncbi:MAG TPA: hypothetical protein VIX81_12435 [Gammaproteobacteria bacterium]
MDGQQGETSRPRALRLNSIRNDRCQRILKPCEARAGHGVIAIFMGLAVIAVVLAGVITLLRKLFTWLFG